jgi:hypothetical protein
MTSNTATWKYDRLVKVKIEQDSGKYGKFFCVMCGHQAHYKFSAGSGWCSECGTSYILTDGCADLFDTKKGLYSAHWMTLQVE